jgi:Mn-containing catalase
MIGYLLVRGGVREAAYALALEKVTGVQMAKMLPLPDIDNKKFEHTRRWEERGEHTSSLPSAPRTTPTRPASGLARQIGPTVQS